ncbi:MAG: hypothetical protein A4E74_01605 [Syntrophus sp. PtaB.Bin075]|nr:MAG: hypothetical protein A4E74_01605 [Syntrophus sp. PtaB.Bin075]
MKSPEAGGIGLHKEQGEDIAVIGVGRQKRFRHLNRCVELPHPGQYPRKLKPSVEMGRLLGKNGLQFTFCGFMSAAPGHDRRHPEPFVRGKAGWQRQNLLVFSGGISELLPGSKRVPFRLEGVSFTLRGSLFEFAVQSRKFLLLVGICWLKES